jgi:tight adherence protein B
MDGGLILTLVVAFIAVVFGLEGAYMLWNDSRGPEVQRLQRRVRMISAGAHGRSTADLLKRRQGTGATLIDRLLLALPRVSSLDRLIEQAGLEFGISRVLSVMGALFVLVLFFSLVAGAPAAGALACAAMAGALPVGWLLWKRSARVAALEVQLPDAIDLIARAMRAGHSFPAAVQMVGEESPEPLSTEFRIVHEEMNFGLAMDDAFRNLSTRVPSDDMRFFVIAVLLQRETGGNLAEVLSNIGRLVRDRMKLLGKVRVLAAEGKFSAWILGLMPVFIAAIINVMNPSFMSLLWKDPVGLNLIYACLVLYALGVLWMWRLIKIRI